MKLYQDNKKIVNSLKNLRKELVNKPEYLEVLLKINSCLFTEYPETRETQVIGK